MSDPRLAVLLADHFAADYAAQLLAALDAVDPLRVTANTPTDEPPVSRGGLLYFATLLELGPTPETIKAIATQFRRMAARSPVAASLPATPEASEWHDYDCGPNFGGGFPHWHPVAATPDDQEPATVQPTIGDMLSRSNYCGRTVPHLEHEGCSGFDGGAILVGDFTQFADPDDQEPA